jgi:hypothetical protein
MAGRVESTMRLWHCLLGVLAVAVVLALVQDPVGCAAVIVFFTGLGEAFVGTASLLMLFQTLGALGEAQGLQDHAHALAATAVVLALGTAFMWGWLLAGLWLLQVAVA